MKGTLFSDSVRTQVARIPKGKVATYGQIARLAGNAKAARAVGMCMQKNTDRKKVPCHRVVGASGALVGYAFGSGISNKKKILASEGVQFKEQNVDLALSQWKV